MLGQACQVTIVSQGGAPHAGTLRPRLDSSLRLIESITLELEGKRRHAAGAGEAPPCSGGPDLPDDGLPEERLACQTIIALGVIESRINGLSALHMIPAALASAIPAIRALSSSLFELMPGPSQRLCELSVTLGSIVVDSAVLTGASCDFGLYNAESNCLLDEAKLMADSKIGKHHPNLEKVKTDST